MANIGEAQITRLTRERLAAIKKFLPVRDSFRDNLQAQQQAKMDFTTDTKQVFAPITTATEKVVTAIEESRPDVAKVATRTKQIKKSLKSLPADIVPPPPEFADTDDGDLQPPTSETQRGFSFIDELTPDFIANIKQFPLTKPSNYKDFGYFAAQSFPSKQDFLKDEYKKSKISQNDWVDWLYKTNMNIDRVNRTEARYKEFRKGIDEYKIHQTKDNQKKQQNPQLTPEEDKTGEGYHRGGEKSNRFSIPCSRSIFDDVSRLEVLIGGKRAGNNFPEIINEAAEICQRLFQGHVIDIGLYRSLINELIDDYYSD